MHRPEREGSWWIPPTLSFIAVNAVLAAAATIEGFDFFDPWTWTRWDSFHYLDISQRGFLIEGCIRVSWNDLVTVRAGLLDLLGAPVEPTHWCGNAGWFPGYPLLIRLAMFFGLPAATAGVSIAVLAQWGTITAVWALFLRKEERASAYLALVAATFFFGHVYYRAVFPMSVTTLLTIVHLHLLLRERWWLAGASGAAAAFTYPTSFLLAPVTLLWLVIKDPVSLWARWRSMVITCGLTLIGYLAVFVVQWRDTAVWGAFYKVQSQFDYGINPPTARLWDIVGIVAERGFELRTVPFLQTLSVAVTMVVILGWSAVRWRTLPVAGKWAVLASAVFWLFPLMLGGRASLYRIESILLPLTIVLPRMGRVFQVFLVVVLLVLSFPMGLLFFRNVLI